MRCACEFSQWRQPAAVTEKTIAVIFPMRLHRHFMESVPIFLPQGSGRSCAPRSTCRTQAVLRVARSAASLVQAQRRRCPQTQVRVDSFDCVPQRFKRVGELRHPKHGFPNPTARFLRIRRGLGYQGSGGGRRAPRDRAPCRNPAPVCRQRHDFGHPDIQDYVIRGVHRQLPQVQRAVERVQRRFLTLAQSVDIDPKRTLGPLDLV